MAPKEIVAESLLSGFSFLQLDVKDTNGDTCFSTASPLFLDSKVQRTVYIREKYVDNCELYKSFSARKATPNHSL